MKRILLIFLIVSAMYTQAQIVITPNPVDINSGLVTITYGSNNDYTIFDPMSNPNLLLYTGFDTDADPTTWDYHDDFNDTSTFIPFNFDATANAYVAQIDVAGRMYQEEPNLNMVNLPQGITVNDWYFIIITTDLSRQSADLKGSDYGWQPATLSNNTFEKEEFKVTAVSDKLFFNTADYYSVKTYNLQGQLVQDINRRYVENQIDMSLLPENQLYISKITSALGTLTIKHIH
ncbi:hypothetical protein [Nonlabens dokdonensis]|nr:hypothetical protein [Nonlabens dokdonensis]